MRSEKQEMTHNPRRGVIDGRMLEEARVLCLFLAVTAIVSLAQNEQPSTQTFTTLHSFDSTDGARRAAGSSIDKRTTVN